MVTKKGPMNKLGFAKKMGSSLGSGVRRRLGPMQKMSGLHAAGSFLMLDVTTLLDFFPPGGGRVLDTKPRSFHTPPPGRLYTDHLPGHDTVRVCCHPNVGCAVGRSLSCGRQLSLMLGAKALLDFWAPKG